MHTRYFIGFLAPLLALAASSCAPTYLLGVAPAESYTLRPNGRDVAEATADSVALRLNFLGYEPDYVIFNAEYRNDSQRPVEVVPTAFGYAPVRQQEAAPPPRRVLRGERVPAAVAAATQHTPWPALPPAPLPALDPEPAIGALENGASHEAAKAARPDWVGVALFAVALGMDIASSTRGRETLAQAQTRAVIHDAAVTYQVIASAKRLHHATTADALARRAALLREYALRRVVLRPGEQVRGYVFLPRFDQADGLDVLAPVGQQLVSFRFVQSHQRR
jgi:hypothetical protein